MTKNDMTFTELNRLINTLREQKPPIRYIGFIHPEFAGIIRRMMRVNDKRRGVLKGWFASGKAER